MKNKPTNKPSHKPKASPIAKKKNPLWLVIISVMVASLFVVLWRNYTGGNITKTSTSTTSSSAQAEQNLLIG